MAQITFPCQFCGKASGFGRRAAYVQAQTTANPYARETRKYRCELCARINDVERSGYDWTLVEWEARSAPPKPAE